MPSECRIKRADLENRIEPFIFDSLNLAEYAVRELPAVDLLTWNRFDLGFKLFYLEHKSVNRPLAIEYYRYDIRAQTLETYSEIGNSSKSSFDAYVDTFDVIDESMQNGGFNADLSIVPCSHEGVIINGSHRVAAAIYHGLTLSCVQLNMPTLTCDYVYFLNRDVPQDVVETAALSFMQYDRHIYAAFLWPAGARKQKQIEGLFNNVVYKKKVSLTPNGVFNLLYELYKHMDWIGVESSRFLGLQQKASACFPKLDDVTVIFFQSHCHGDVLALKKSIRDINDIGFSSVHITDTHEEVMNVARLLLNPNGLHYLNHADPVKRLSGCRMVKAFREAVAEVGNDLRDYVLDSGTVLASYGFRKATDIDYVTTSSEIGLNNKSILGFELSNHDSELVHHQLPLQSLVYDSRSFFWVEGAKLLSFEQILGMKRRRNSSKDKIDVNLMEAYVGTSHRKACIARFRQKVFFFIMIIRGRTLRGIAVVLQRLGLFDFVYNIYFRKSRKLD